MKSTNGTTVTKKGYVRITKGKNRNKYEHRAVVEGLMAEVWHPFFGDTVPDWIQIHHVNRVRSHNCPCNLQLLDSKIHEAITELSVVRHPYTGRFLTMAEYKRTMGDW